MTPSLQQAIKLLQMSKLELQEEVQQELVENPVLEESQLEASSTNEREEGENTDGADKAESDSTAEAMDDFDYESYLGDNDPGDAPRAPRETGEPLPAFENTLSRPPDLADQLEMQLNLATSSELGKAIGLAIIGNIDEDGYLQATVEEIQRIGGYERVEVESVLELIQSFDPDGVAARDLTECLLIQLHHRGEEGTPAELIVREHMDKLQARRYKELASVLGLDMEDLQAEIEVIRGLDPKPGQKYNVESSTYVVPDVYIVKIDDEYRVMLNEEGLPRLRISPVYRRMVGRGEGAPADAKEYVRKKLRSAFRLIKSLEERQRTIFKVATSIVKFQREFLDYGIEKLRPLVLKDVADDIGMHESTVSRVVNNKYMHTHRGLFEMRFFFHSGIASSRGGASVSSLTVKDRIRRIIQGEEPQRPLSDSAIVKVLKSEGLQIARRTVAKYREELKIPASSNRKQVFT
jgi:RNA polymerase sigma-54 factor